MLEKNEIQKIVEEQILPYGEEIASWRHSSVEVENMQRTYEVRSEWFELKRGYKAKLFEDILELLRMTNDVYVCLISIEFTSGKIGFALINSNKKIFFKLLGKDENS